jgi:hypothetical protein
MLMITLVSSPKQHLPKHMQHSVNGPYVHIVVQTYAYLSFLLN